MFLFCLLLNIQLTYSKVSRTFCSKLLIIILLTSAKYSCPRVINLSQILFSSPNHPSHSQLSQDVSESVLGVPFKGHLLSSENVNTNRKEMTINANYKYNYCVVQRYN